MTNVITPCHYVITDKSCSLNSIPAILSAVILKYLTAVVNASLYGTWSLSASIADDRHRQSAKEVTVGCRRSKELSYRPVSNLTFMSEVVSGLLQNNLSNICSQTVCCHGCNRLIGVKLKFHWDQFPRNFLADLLATEPVEATALVRVLSDISCAVLHQHVALLSLLDPRTALHSARYEISVRRLERSFGISRSAIAWIEWFLRDRSMQQVSHAGCQQSLYSFSLALFLARTVSTIRRWAVRYRECRTDYADHTQVYIDVQPRKLQQLCNNVACIERVDAYRWMLAGAADMASYYKQLDKLSFIELSPLSVKISSSAIVERSCCRVG